jgi:magnesium chelatase family protein
LLANAQTCAVVGLDGFIVQVEVDISPGPPAFNIVGLPDTAVQEAKERVRAALSNSGCEFPLRRITVNLAPADLKKEGPAYDLPIAVGILISFGQLDSTPTGSVFVGELSLDGSLRHTNGILALVSVALEQGYTSAFVPAVDADEASLVEDIRVLPVPTLEALIQHFRCETEIQPASSDLWATCGESEVPDQMNLTHVRGQEHAKRALEAAAAGFHNLLFNGPPGSGKTLLARCLPSILTRMAAQEALEITKIYSVKGALQADNSLVLRRPFRSPHYTISNAGLVGGGRTLRPEEITLSHRGVLFLEELPEFNHTALESWRQPLEDKVVTISRVSGTVTYPASFMLVAAMNPCPCGFHSHPSRECTCSPSTVTRNGLADPFWTWLMYLLKCRRWSTKIWWTKAQSKTLAAPGRGWSKPGKCSPAFSGVRFPVQLGDGPCGSVEVLSTGRGRQGPATDRHSAPQPLGPRFPPQPKSLQNHRRPRRF